jgi:hypothetical protein
MLFSTAAVLATRRSEFINCLSTAPPFAKACRFSNTCRIRICVTRSTWLPMTIPSEAIDSVMASRRKRVQRRYGWAYVP